jgi:hypothetical protein
MSIQVIFSRCANFVEGATRGFLPRPRTCNDKNDRDEWIEDMGKDVRIVIEPHSRLACRSRRVTVCPSEDRAPNRAAGPWFVRAKPATLSSHGALALLHPNSEVRICSEFLATWLAFGSFVIFRVFGRRFLDFGFRERFSHFVQSAPGAKGASRCPGLSDSSVPC